MGSVQLILFTHTVVWNKQVTIGLWPAALNSLCPLVFAGILQRYQVLAQLYPKFLSTVLPAARLILQGVVRLISSRVGSHKAFVPASC